MGNLYIRTVDDAGKFTAEAGPFAGLEVMKGGNKAVIAALQESGCLVKSEKYIHKYPYDWRSKEPILIRYCGCHGYKSNDEV